MKRIVVAATLAAALAASVLFPTAALADDPADPAADPSVEQPVDPAPVDPAQVDPAPVDPVPADPALIDPTPAAAGVTAAPAAVSPSDVLLSCVFTGRSRPGGPVGPVVRAVVAPIGPGAGLNLTLPAVLYNPTTDQTQVVVATSETVTNFDAPTSLCAGITSVPVMPISATISNRLYGCLYLEGATIDNLGVLVEGGTFSLTADALDYGFTGTFPFLANIEDLGPVLLLGYQRFNDDGFSFDLCPSGDGRTAQPFNPTEPTPPVAPGPMTPAVPTAVTVAATPTTFAPTGTLPNAGGPDRSLLVLGGLLVASGVFLLGLRRRSPRLV